MKRGRKKLKTRKNVIIIFMLQLTSIPYLNYDKRKRKKNYGNVPNDFVNEANSVQMSVRIYSHEGNLE